jgi:transketolase
MGALKGGYIAMKETAPLEMIILASGSELQWAMDVATKLGGSVRVVSMPCFERFDRQDAAYRAEVLPTSCRKRVAIEAGVTGLWYKYVGLSGKVIGTDEFGLSAPGATCMDVFGLNASHLFEVAQQLQKTSTSEGKSPKSKLTREHFECATTDSLPKATSSDSLLETASSSNSDSESA